MSAVNLEDAYRYNREAELKRMGKGVLWLMLGRGSGLVSTSHKDVMVIAIMRQEAAKRLEKDRGEVGGGCGMLHADTRFSAASAAEGSTPIPGSRASARGKGKGATPSPAASQNPSGEGLGGGGMLHCV